MTLERQGRIEMDLQLEKLVSSSHLKTGKIFAILRASGNSPREKDKLQIKDKGVANKSIASLIGVIQMPSWLSLLLFLREHTPELISVAEVWESRKLLRCDPDKNIAYMGYWNWLASWLN